MIFFKTDCNSFSAGDIDMKPCMIYKKIVSILWSVISKMYRLLKCLMNLYEVFGLLGSELLAAHINYKFSTSTNLHLSGLYRKSYSITCLNVSIAC